jgi:hypothetical protein
MDTPANFSSLWNALEEFELPSDQPAVPSCLFAQKFSEWATELCAKVTREPGIVSVNQAKVLLLDKYFEWRSVVPKAHRNRIGKSGHVCIFHVFEQTYLTLKTVELSLTPPMLFVPPPPLAPPPPPQIAGVFLGELDQP